LTSATGFAGAKVNLYLHVGAPGADGYHPIESLMAFADIGDRLLIEPARLLSYSAGGPFAGAAPMNGDNLVVRAVRAILDRAPPSDSAFRLHLQKILPVAAGLGGGSADAAAALRLVNEALGLGLKRRALREIGETLGADVPACVISRAVIAGGRGEQLSAPPALPPLHAVLANPMVPLATGAVFAAFDAGPAPGPLSPDLPSGFADVHELAAWLAAETRNDLAAAARGLAPAAGEAADRLATSPLALLARMSGSGATAFALCAGADEAQQLADQVRAKHPGWWVQACRLA